MTDLTIEPVCGASAASCKCRLNPGHAGPHECENVDDCDGAWSGDYNTGVDFAIVRLPGPALGFGGLL